MCNILHLASESSEQSPCWTKATDGLEGAWMRHYLVINRNPLQADITNTRSGVARELENRKKK